MVSPYIRVILLLLIVGLLPPHYGAEIAGFSYNGSYGDIIVAVTLMLLLFDFVKKRSVALPVYLLPVLGFFMWIILSGTLNGVIIGTNIKAVLVQTVKLAGSVAWAIAVHYLLQENTNSRTDILALSVVVFSVIYIGPTILTGVSSYGGREIGTFRNPNIFGNYIIFATFMSLYIGYRGYMAKRSNWRVYLATIAIPLLLIALLLSASRGAAVAYTVTVVPVLLLMAFSYSKSVGGVGLLASGGGMITAYKLLPEAYFERLTDTERNVQTRLNRWSESLDYFFANPISGSGYVDLGTHNILIKYLSETGTVGVIIILSLALYLARRISPIVRTYPAVIFFIFYIIATLTQGLVTDVDNFRTLWITVGVIGAYISSELQQKVVISIR